MNIVVSKWGNSLGIRIPEFIANSMNLGKGSHVSIDIDHDTITLKPVKSEDIKIENLMESFYHKPLTKITPEDVGESELVDWGEDAGNEAINW